MVAIEIRTNWYKGKIIIIRKSNRNNAFSAILFILIKLIIGSDNIKVKDPLIPNIMNILNLGNTPQQWLVLQPTQLPTLPIACSSLHLAITQSEFWLKHEFWFQIFLSSFFDPFLLHYHLVGNSSIWILIETFLL